MPPVKSKKELDPCQGKINYLSTFLPITTEGCEPLQKLTLVKTYWAWNGMYQDLYDRTRKIIKEDACMKFFDVSRTLCLETDVPGASLGTRLLQVGNGMNWGIMKYHIIQLYAQLLLLKSLLSAE